MNEIIVTSRCRIHVAKWRTLFQHNRLRHWGVRRSPKIQLFLELRLQKPSTPIASDSMSTPTKEQSSLESTGNLDITKLLDELEIPSRSQNSTSSSVLLVKKLLQFDNSSRPAYYGTWRKKRYYSPDIITYGFFLFSYI
jgi:chromatin assembly factor 1 subunit A